MSSFCRCAVFLTLTSGYTAAFFGFNRSVSDIIGDVGRSFGSGGLGRGIGSRARDLADFASVLTGEGGADVAAVVIGGAGGGPADAVRRGVAVEGSEGAAGTGGTKSTGRTALREALGGKEAQDASAAFVCGTKGTGFRRARHAMAR